NNASNCRVANRNNNTPDNRNNNIGFRLACSTKQRIDFEQKFVTSSYRGKTTYYFIRLVAKVKQRIKCVSYSR
ncbi:MAG: hypothetical protein LBR17_01360, partial [Bacteroidales bacterium]|nr:hypothetical protein [Bacteroidales bacterium]